MIKLVQFQCLKNKITRAGLLLPHSDGSIVDILPHTSMNNIINNFNSKTFEDLRKLILNSPTSILPKSEVKIVAPITPQRNVFCVGKNYFDHVAEIQKALSKNSDQSSSSSSSNASVDVPKAVMFFTKAPQCVIGPDDEVESHSQLTKWLDYEAELAVIIGKTGKNISEKDAMSHVFGYTAANDVTARDLQKRHGQFFKGKTLDTTCPLGPVIIPAGDIDPTSLDIKLTLNGTIMQNSNTSKMIFKIPEIISQLSQGFTLMPGDVILTGTPDGVGYARQPPIALKAGDRMEVDIQGIGSLRNSVR